MYLKICILKVLVFGSNGRESECLVVFLALQISLERAWTTTSTSTVIWEVAGRDSGTVRRRSETTPELDKHNNQFVQINTIRINYLWKLEVIAVTRVKV
ncbi:hypothetical protein RchiOBHm_Chr2g0141861 [Rosa chinensis]|uniref:Uncharacterized protein n=1 Tax=Rosa chinensis TaxID=74649 RepID=A0A2P6RXQ1_ROSCH|nr:hypothetical protein RchiOBHm_Chr2g0141861 [Rosa chinensis]